MFRSLLHQLRLLCWKGFKTEIRKPFAVFTYLFTLTLICTALWYLVNSEIINPVRKKYGKVWSGDEDAQRAAYENRVGVRRRSNDNLYFNCETINERSEACEAIKNDMDRHCNRFACFPHEIGLNYGEYLKIVKFNGSSYTATVTNSENVNSPEFVTASEEFELPRPLPFSPTATTRFHVSALVLFGEEHGYFGEVNDKVFPVAEYYQSSNSIVFADQKSAMYSYLIVLLIPVFASLQLATALGNEIRSEIKDYLHAMGFTRFIYLLHHILIAMAKSLPFIVAVSFILFYPNLEFVWLFFVTFLFYYISCLAVAITIATVIHNHKIVPDVILLGMPMVLLMPIGVPVIRTEVLRSTLSCINPGYALFNALDALKECSYKGGHLTWFIDYGFVLPFGVTLLTQILDTCILIAIAVAADYLISSNSFTFAHLNPFRRKEDNEARRDIDIHEDAEVYEGMEIAIEIDDLHKTFFTGEQAVRGVHLKVYKNQITMLLGQNGAGKSTTFDMITGKHHPTSGSIKIDGIPTTERHNANYEKISLCPQNSPCFSMLTVAEHLYFFTRLSNGVWDTAMPDKIVEMLKLQDETGKYAKNLSGGNLRKLCVAMALVGDNKIVLLDEPTAGVDTESRVVIRDFLKEMKMEKTLLITTHYTDEAADMGDRVAIMANGRVACSGSQDFLFHQFVPGYRISCVVAEKVMLDSISDRTLRLAQAYVPATLLRSHGEEFCISLPANDMERLNSFLRELDTRKETMGIVNYGMGVAHLEDVFISVATMTGSLNDREKVNKKMEEFLEENKNRASPWRRKINSLLALIYKRFWFEWRNKFYQIFAVFMVVATLAAGKMAQNVVHPSPELDLLKLRECGRIGVVNAPHLSESIRQMGFDRGECLVVQEITDAAEWYRLDHFMRSPIIGAIERDEENYTIIMAQNRRIYEPYVATLLYQAITNATVDMKLSFQRKPNFHYDPVIMEKVCLFVLFTLMINAISRHIRVYVIEAENGYDHQQILTGVSPFLYWLGHFIVDSCLFAIVYTYMFILCCIFDFAANIFKDLLFEIVLCFFVTIVQIAIIKRCFKSKNTANSTVSSILTFSLMLLLPVYLRIQEEIPQFSLESSFLLFVNPFLAVFIYQIQIPVGAPGIYSILFGQLVIFGSIFFCLENRSLRKFVARTLHHSRRERREDNRRVESGGDIEMQPLSSQTKADDEMGVEAKPNGAKTLALDVDNIKKKYGKTMAVRGVSFAVDTNECFGMLGHNGAGKSTVFNILTGKIFADSGEATVSDVDCTKPAHIGYCPQVDALINQLYGREHLIVLAALHGFANPHKVADILLACVGMEKHCNKRFKELSGGQKRKLSVLASILATSKVIILDEPTSSIDAMVRNDIWNLLNTIRDSTNTAIVLTSHSMCEVEILCSRVAIMRQGLIVAHGTPQTLKSTYGDYLKLLIRVPTADPVANKDEITRAVVELIPNAIYLTQSLSCYEFKIPRLPSDSYSEMFAAASAVARIVEATNFWLVQSNLEDTFLALSETAKE